MTTEPGAEPTAALPAVPGGESQVVYVREPSHWGRRLLVFIGSLGVLVAVVFGLQSFHLLPSISNPFAKQTTDRTGPVLLDSMRDLSRYVAAEGNFQVLVDLQVNNKFVPDFLYNRHTLFVGVGSVQAYVDFAKLTDGNIKVSADGTAVDITLPQPVLDKPVMDPQNSYLYADDKGIFNRVGDAFSSTADEKYQQLTQLASQKIADAANQSELVSRAQKNTESMLTSLLHQLNFDRVTITFVPPSAP
jgi:uncharacterized protein DUF4230